MIIKTFYKNMYHFMSSQHVQDISTGKLNLIVSWILLKEKSNYGRTQHNICVKDSSLLYFRYTSW